MENEAKYPEIQLPIGCPVYVTTKRFIVEGYTERTQGEMLYRLKGDSGIITYWHYSRVDADPQEVIKWRMTQSLTTE